VYRMWNLSEGLEDELKIWLSLYHGMALMSVVLTDNSFSFCLLWFLLFIEASRAWAQSALRIQKELWVLGKKPLGWSLGFFDPFRSIWTPGNDLRSEAWCLQG
jgi:hypothetical protein